MIADEMRQESSRVLPKAVTPENVPAADRGKRFHRFFRTFEIASVKKGGVVTGVRQYIFGKRCGRRLQIRRGRAIVSGKT